MFSPQPSLYNLICTGSQDELKAALNTLKTTVGYPMEHTAEAEYAFMRMIQGQITNTLKTKTPEQMDLFLRKMRDRCIDFGYRLDREGHGYFVDANNQSIKNDTFDGVESFLVDMFHAVPAGLHQECPAIIGMYMNLINEMSGAAGNQMRHSA